MSVNLVLSAAFGCAQGNTPQGRTEACPVCMYARGAACARYGTCILCSQDVSSSCSPPRAYSAGAAPSTAPVELKCARVNLTAFSVGGFGAVHVLPDASLLSPFPKGGQLHLTDTVACDASPGAACGGVVA